MFFPFHDDNPTRRTPVFTFGLIAVNAIVFVLALRMPSEDQMKTAYRWGFVPARIAQLSDPRLIVPVEIPVEKVVFHPAKGWVRVKKIERFGLRPDRREILTSLFTCMFLHGGWMHLIGNMWFLWIFGNNVEDRLGPGPFLVLYLGGGLLATASHWIVDPGSIVPVIGASGAVATVLGAYAITWPWARVRTLVVLIVFITIIDLPALLVLGAWFAGQLWAGRNALIQGEPGGVAWWAHVGGFVAGLLLMPIFSTVLGVGGARRQRRRSSHDSW